MGTIRHERQPRTRCCAQRLSASPRGHSLRSSSPTAGPVLNAFRHHRRGIFVAFNIVLAKAVLNAFRHHRGGHTSVLTPLSRATRVLNAFRHHGGGTADPPIARRANGRCAQRLSASPKWATTPGLGIGDRRYRAQRLSASPNWACVGLVSLRDARLVLNAFRHHRRGMPRSDRGRAQSESWCSTPFGITEVGIGCVRDELFGRTVDVLNAFRHHRRGHHDAPGRAHPALRVCSTPFGITEVGIRCGARSLCCLSRVLNAFRHHRSRHGDSACTSSGDALVCSTPFGITEMVDTPRTDAARSSPVCSTPFGITEVGMSRLRRIDSVERRVLNAFRHHRGGHLTLDALRLDVRRAQRLSASPKSHADRTRRRGRGRHRCSTPFGITEVASDPGLTTATVTQRCAQRLSASRGRHGAGSASRCGLYVLNAFRHHRRWSHEHSETVAGPDARCSTPFGITEVARRRPSNSTAESDVCSTPFGITELVHGRLAALTVGRRVVLNAFRHHRGGARSTCRATRLAA